MLSLTLSDWWNPVDDVVDAGNAVVDAAKATGNAIEDAANWIYNNAGDVYDAVKKYGCVIVNNDTIVTAVSVGTGAVVGFVATPAAGVSAASGVQTGAQAGKQACQAIKVADGVLATIKAQTPRIPPPPGVTPPSSGVTPPSAPPAIFQPPLHFMRAATQVAPAPVTTPVPLFKKPLFWVAVGAGALALGGGAVYASRRRS